MRNKLIVFAALVLFAPAAPALQADEWPRILTLVETRITDNGDGDGFADTNETVWIEISLEPDREDGFNDCVARISTDSPAIDCMRRSEIYIGDLPAKGPAVTPTEKFEIKVSNLDRGSLGLGPDDNLEATLLLTFQCSPSYHNLPRSQEITLPLDLNVTDLGQTPVPWAEGFEDGTYGRFSPQNNDAGLPGASDEEGVENADGWRCQYTDPDWVNSETYNQSAAATCYPGMNLAQADKVFWQIDGEDVAASPDGGRAKSGSYSMYYGIFIEQPDTDLFTTPISTVEAVGTTDPIHLGTNSPRLGFWHQLSLMDHRRVGLVNRTAIDRGVVQIQLTDAADTEPGFWTNLTAAVNPYASVGGANILKCMFDPIDDGNTEDDFYLPLEPWRNRGPSSTCADQLIWSSQGDTSPAPFDVGNVGNATTPPATSDAPSLGSGTWVRSEIDLTPFRGRSARFRFLVSSWKGFHETNHEEFSNNGAMDDGWWIDDVVIDETLTDPAHFSNDGFLLGTCAGTGEACIGQCRLSMAPCFGVAPCDEGEGDCVLPCPPGDVCSGDPPDCGANCSEAQMNVLVEPDGPFNPVGVTTGEPGERVELNFVASFDASTGAEPSWVDVCIDGVQEYRSCISGDPDGGGPAVPDADCDDPWDDGTWGWNLYPGRNPSPDVVTTYAGEVRCSSARYCRDGRTVEIFVECPNRNPNTLGLREIRALDKQMLTWRGVLDVDWLRGSFTTGTEIGDYVADFTASSSAASSIPMDGDPQAGTGYYYLVKRDGPPSPFQVYLCDTVTWRSSGDSETNEPARNQAFGNP